MSSARTHLGGGVYVEYCADDGAFVWCAEEPREGVRMGDEHARQKTYLDAKRMARLVAWWLEHMGPLP